MIFVSTLLPSYYAMGSAHLHMNALVNVCCRCDLKCSPKPEPSIYTLHLAAVVSASQCTPTPPDPTALGLL